MKSFTKLLIGLGCITALSTPLVQAETAPVQAKTAPVQAKTAPVQAPTGSDLLFNAKLAQLQCEIRVRNQLADELIQYQLARGYSTSTSEELGRKGKAMLSRADNDAFAKEMENLRRTIELYELKVCAR